MRTGPFEDRHQSLSHVGTPNLTMVIVVAINVALSYPEAGCECSPNPLSTGVSVEEATPYLPVSPLIRATGIDSSLLEDDFCLDEEVPAGPSGTSGRRCGHGC